MGSPLRAVLALCLAALTLLSQPLAAKAASGPIAIDVSAPSRVGSGAQFDVTVRATNRGSAVGTWSVSLAIPDGGKLTLVSPKPFTSGRSYARVFNPGDAVFDFSARKSVPATYPMAEVYRLQTWPAGATRSLTVRVTAPASASSMRLFARAAVRDSSGKVLSYPQDGVLGQQGLPVLVRNVSLSSAPPATSTPSPTRRPSPTRTPTRAPAPTATASQTLAPTRSPSPTATAPPIVVPVVTTLPTATSPAPTATETPPAPVPTATPAGGGWDPVLNLVLTLVGLAVVAGAVTLFASWTSRRSPTPLSRGLERRPEAPAGRPGPIAGPRLRRDVGDTAPLLPVATVAREEGETAPFAPLPILPPGLTPAGEVRHGGMADVYRAYQPSLDRYVAVKVPRPDLMADDGFSERFRAEARRTAKLSHPNIVTVYDVGEARGVPYMTMRYVDGPSLSERISSGERMPRRHALGIVEQVALALDYAHSQGVVHGDVKPSNVLLGADDHVTLTDFGVSRVLGPDVSAHGAAYGTPDYISPEQARGEQPGPAADTYSLGVVAYELLVGRRPFSATDTLALVYAHAYSPPLPPDQIDQSLPPGASRALLKALAKDPDDRYGSAAELVAALRRELRS